jgi:hypothetical protein
LDQVELRAGAPAGENIMAEMRRKSVLGTLALALLAVAAMLAFFGAAAPAAVAASGPLGTGAISGRVFFDANGDGLIGSAPAEQGVAAVTLQLLGATPTITTATDASGVYTFSGLAAGSYTVAELPPAGYVTTTTTSKPVSVGAGLVGGVNFGVAYPIFLTGAVCQDTNADGMCGLATVEPRIAGATVQVFDDANRNELIDMGEATLATTLTDTRGQYLVSNLRPGSRIVLIRLPGGADSTVDALSLTSSEAGAATFLQNFAVGQSAIQGTVFKDLNGNEFIDAGESPLAGAVVQLLPAAGGDAAGVAASVIATATTGLDGKYVFPKLLVAAYQVQVAPSSTPAGWLLSPDRSALIPALQANVTTTLNVGFFDPKAAPPMSLADWKRELRQSGQWAYTATELQNYIATAQAGSRVFSETVALRDALLLGGAAGVSAEKWRALKETAALWMNLASLRLRPETPVKLGTLSAATTVRQARDEVESLLLYGVQAYVVAGGRESERRAADEAQESDQALAPRDAVALPAADYSRALAIAQALNTGKGVGAGLTGTSPVVDAIYRGAQVSNKLKPGGDVVDLPTDGPLTLRKWSPGSYKTTINTLNAQARIRVKSFNQGGVLDVVQVFPNGRRLTLGTAQSVVQNKDVNAIFTFNLSRVTTVAELVNTTLVLTVRDVDAGKAAIVKVDSAEIIFGY